MSGFKDEKELWKWMSNTEKMRMQGKWTRIECIYPPGIPDVLGTYMGLLIWIELKVGMPNPRALESGQIDFMNWMHNSNRPCYVCWGDPDVDTTRWWYWPSRNFDIPPFWKGPYSCELPSSVVNSKSTRRRRALLKP